MEEYLRGDWWSIPWKTDYLTPEFLKQCNQNPNFPQNISQNTKYCIKMLSEAGFIHRILQSTVLFRIPRSLRNIWVEEEYHNNENETNIQK